ncbi:MAG TPA: glycosyltransferase [Candidatus Babeliales bacterium]|nr:glycosyltransferase [Candidatus Babeliales bacterium]
MKRCKTLIAAIWVLISWWDIYGLHHIPYASFDISMGASADQKSPQKYEGRYQFLNAFKWLYARNNFTRVVPQARIKIPKIIHHIWLGSQFPTAYETYYRSWKEHHPEWCSVFWTDNPINFSKGERVVGSFDELSALLGTEQSVKRLVVDVRTVSFTNRIYFDQATNYGEKSDILRYEILYNVGGLYVDTDFESLQPCDLLHHMYDLYVGIQPLDTGYGQLGIGLVGAIVGHPLMKLAIENIKNSCAEKQIICRTGPFYFTRLFCHYMKNGLTIDVALPASYFYPMGYDQQRLSSDIWQKKESFAVHHWAGSWLPTHATIG